MKIRAKFSKQGYVRYVGHLDTMRLFQRAIKVAKLPVAYSQGFSPHSLVYFAMPLAVGMSSQGEYMEIVMKEDISPEEVKERLSKALVPGIELVDVFAVEDKTTSLMSLVQAANYSLYVKADGITAEGLQSRLEEADELIVMKKGKKGIAPLDIKPLILNAAFYEADGRVGIDLQVYAGSSKNLNPEFLVKALLGETSYQLEMVRKELYTEGVAGDLVPLYEVGRLA